MESKASDEKDPGNERMVPVKLRDIRTSPSDNEIIHTIPKDPRLPYIMCLPRDMVYMATRVEDSRSVIILSPEGIAIMEDVMKAPQCVDKSTGKKGYSFGKYLTERDTSKDPETRDKLNRIRNSARNAKLRGVDEVYRGIIKRTNKAIRIIDRSK